MEAAIAWLLCVGLAGCMPQKIPPPVPHPANFTYTPAANSTARTRHVTFTILAAKGFGVRGPYDSYDLIPYQDKKDIGMLVVPTVDLEIVINDLKEKPESMRKGGSPRDQTATVHVSGKVLVELQESTTRQLMWAKTVPIKAFDFPYFVRMSYNAVVPVGQPYDYNPIYDGMAKGVAEQYPGIMATIYRLIDAEEMAVLKKQTQEIKGTKGS